MGEDGPDSDGLDGLDPAGLGDVSASLVGGVDVGDELLVGKSVKLIW